MKRKGTAIIIAVCLIIYIVFLFWYGGNSKPLTQNETDTLIALIQNNSGYKGNEEGTHLKELRELVKADDGKEFYMINLMKFRQKALYPAGSAYNDDVMAANGRYSQAIVPNLLKHGSFPVFAATVSGSFISENNSDNWDQVGMVRYRSRRDLLLMASEIAVSRIDIHKWAALEKTHVFPVVPYINLIFVRSIVALILVGFGFLAVIIQKRLTLKG